MENPAYNLGSHPLFDRPELALNQLVSGEFAAAGRALYDPDALTPSQRRSMAERLGLADTPLEGLINVASNPLVLVGLAMSLRWPLPEASALANFTGKFTGLIKRWGWARFVSPVSEVYRGTPIPNLLQGILRERQTELKIIHEEWAEALKKFQAATGRQYLNSRENNAVAAILDGLDDPNHQSWRAARAWLERAVIDGGAGRPDLAAALENVQLPALQSVSPAVRALAEDSRRIFSGIWERNLSTPEKQTALRSILSHRAGFADNLAESELKRVRDYFPHLRDQTPEEVWVAVQRFWAQHGKTSIRRAMKRGMETRQTTTSAANRSGKVMPNPAALRALGASEDVLRAVNYIDGNRLLNAVNSGKKIGDFATTALTTNGQPIYYSLDYTKTLTRYADEIARARAVSLPPVPGATAYGKRLRAAVDRIANEDEYGLFMARQLEDTVIPQVLGGMSERQANSAMRWAATKSKAIESIAALHGKKMLPAGVARTLTKWLADDPSSSMPGLGSRISSWLYASTLGLPNPVPAAMNLLQPITTAMPLGPQYMIPGYGRAIKQFFKYAELRAGGATSEIAIRKAMPEFYSAHLELDPTSTEMVREAIDSTVQRAFQTGEKFKTLTDKTKSLLLSLFSHSEMFNRLVTFETARAKGLVELPGKNWHFIQEGVTQLLPQSSKSKAVQRAALDFATEMTYMTQFGGGPLQRPMGTLNWWSPLAQFTTFPGRMAGLVAGPMLRDPGYLGRALFVAGSAYEVARQGFDADISRGLLFGGLPEPSGYGPFPVLPVVPPALQLAGGAVMSGVTGESEHIRRSLPLLVPGGVGLARAIGYVPGGQPVAELVEKKYADYQHRDANGRVPVYTARGALTGYFSETQLLSKAFGIGDVSGDREVQLMKYLSGQQKSIQNLKKQYLQALTENDADTMMYIAEEYEHRYPGTGGLPIRDSDIRAIHLREDVTRLERFLETLPPELRQQYTNLVNTALAANAPQMLGLMQQMSGNQTINLREPFRTHTYAERRTQAESMAPSMHGVKLRDKLGLRGQTPLGRKPTAGHFYDVNSNPYSY